MYYDNNEKIFKSVIQLTLEILIVLYYYIFKVVKALSKQYEKGFEKMGTIVCQTCNSTIDHFEDEKVSVLYSKKCDCCDHEGAEER